MNTLVKPRFTWQEFSGSLGDLGLFIPLVVGMTMSCHLDMGVILIWAGVMNIMTGLVFRQPVPVQPMKAVAVVAITEQLLPGELAAAGLLMGAFLLMISGIVDRVSAVIPRAIVRGIQLGIGIKLAIKGVAAIAGLPLFGWNSLAVAIIIAGVLGLTLRTKQPVLLFIFLTGFFLHYQVNPYVFNQITFRWPSFAWHWPEAEAWKGGLFKGALPQIPVTLLNSVIALCALSEIYFPGKGLAPRKVTRSVGWMNLCACALGGIPMCHGAGGLAAQYQFGARTGGSVIMLGVLKVIAGLVFGSALIGLLGSYPMAVLAPMLLFAGIGLARSAEDILGQKSDCVLAAVVAGLIVAVNTLVGFSAGCLIAGFVRIVKRKETE